MPGFTRTEFHEVGDFKNFDRSVIPDSLWMMPDEVVSLSLKALEKDKELSLSRAGKSVCIKWLILHSSIVRKTIQNKVEKELYVNC